jgi:endonuclease-3 related protein
MRKKLQAIYKKLYSHFGPQHWWPADHPFEVMVGAILTQNTNWNNVLKAIGSLKKHRALKPQALSSMSVETLARRIKSAGYYTLKAKRLKNYVRFFLKQYKGSAGKMAVTDTLKLRDALLAVNGIGQETADSILLYALGKPVFVVDSYTKRIMSRHGLLADDASYHLAQDLFMKHLQRKSALFNEYHALLVKLGKEYCLKNKPKCETCPLRT